MSQQLAVYCQGTFEVANPTAAQQASMTSAATAITAAGYTTVILGQWHAKVDSNGDFNIYYNDTPYSSSAFEWTLQNITEQLHSGGVQYVTMTFGPFSADFDAIRENLDSFKAIVKQIITDYSLNGLDFDPEISGGNPYTSENQKMLIDLAAWIAELNLQVVPQLITTASPYTDAAWWGELLQNSSDFAYINVQSIPNTGGYAYWQEQLSPPANTSILCGFNVSDSNTDKPSDITTYLQGLPSSDTSYDGVVYWNYHGMDQPGDYTPQQWADAVPTSTTSSAAAAA